MPELIRSEQVRLAYGHLPPALFATVAISLALVMLLWDKQDHTVMLGWLSLIAVLSAVRYMQTLRYRKSAPEASAAWDRRFAFGAIAAGILWGSIPVVMFPSHAVPYQAMIAVVLAGMSAGASITLSSRHGVLQAFLVLALLPLIIRLAMEDNALSITMAGMGALFLVIISATARMFHRNTTDNIRLSLEAQQREQMLKQTEEQYRHLFETANDAIFISDMDDRLIQINRMASERLGYRRQDEMMDMDMSRLLSPASAAAKPSHDRELREHGHLFYEAEHVRRDGTIMPVEVNAQIIDYHGQQAVLSIVRDISERKQAEGRLRILSRALEQAGESVIITDRDGRIEYVNPAFSSLTGYTAAEAKGRDLRWLEMKSGSQGTPIDQELWSTVGAGKTWQRELSCRRKDGTEISMFMSASPVIGDDGSIAHFVGIQRDITEHVKLEEQLRQAQKMEAVGTLVGGIAHDFNNMLAGITGNLFLAKKGTLELPEVTEKLEISEKLAFNASKIIQQLLTFARQGSVEIKPLALGRFMRETSHLYEVSILENIAYAGLFCEQELAIRGDDTQLQQMIINLLNNARDAVAGVSDPRITLRLEAFDAPPAFQRQHDVTTRHFARISVEDNGSGMRADILERIFEPFFTTKEVGRGTGLGLAMVYGTVMSHGGLIDVESEPGSGTAFRIYLPLHNHVAPSSAADDAESPLAGRGETLLVVDDDPQVRDITRFILEALDYRVLTASDGVEAIEVFNDSTNDIKLIIMDLIMPRLGGVRAYEQLHRLDQDVRVIFVTGHDLHQGLENESPRDEAIVLHKPWSTTKLSRTIRTVLDGQPAP